MKWVAALVLLSLVCVGCARRAADSAAVTSGTPPVPAKTLPLPEPKREGTVSVEQALAGRSSIRAFAPSELSAEQLSQLLWAAQGITRPDSGGRTAPSAFAVYPLQIYVADSRGTWRYVSREHALEQTDERDLRADLADAAAKQSWIAEAPAVLVFTVSEKQMATKNKDRAARYVNLEAGHACQNLLLQATALELGGTSVGSLSESKISVILGLPRDRYPVYVVPIGRPLQ